MNVQKELFVTHPIQNNSVAEKEQRNFIEACESVNNSVITRSSSVNRDFSGNFTTTTKCYRFPSCAQCYQRIYKITKRKKGNYAIHFIFLYYLFVLVVNNFTPHNYDEHYSNKKSKPYTMSIALSKCR